MCNQLVLGFSENRKHSAPFDMHIFNADLGSIGMKQLQKRIPTVMDGGFPLDVHQNCFTDEIPKENLLYLTPYSPNVLKHYNPKDTYVVGGVVDRGRGGSVTLARAKEMGLRTAWLPFDHYLPWVGRHDLPLDIIMKILLDFKNKRGWREAFKHVPKRKIQSARGPREMPSVASNEHFGGIKTEKMQTELNPFKIE